MRKPFRKNPLTNLLGFDGVRELGSKLQMCDGHIVEDNVEATSALTQTLAHQTADLVRGMGGEGWAEGRRRRRAGKDDTSSWSWMAPSMNSVKYPLSLGDQLGGVELCHDTLQRLIDDGGQDDLIVVHPKGLEDGRQSFHIGLRQDTQCDVDHLQVFHAVGR